MGHEAMARAGEHVLASVAVGSIGEVAHESTSRVESSRSTYALLVLTQNALSAYEMSSDYMAHGDAGCLFSVPMDAVAGATLTEQPGAGVRLRLDFADRPAIAAYIPRSQVARAQQLVRVLADDGEA